MNNLTLIEAKVNELSDMLRNSSLTDEQIQNIRRPLNDALKAASIPGKIDAFREVGTDHTRLEMMDDLELLLSQHQLDSNISKKYLYRERLKKTVVIIIGIIMILLGMGMIIMPAPPYFEMFTLFYFNANDGVTIMDLISLLIVFTGVYLLISTVIKKA